jgi:hypothetical protein
MNVDRLIIELQKLQHANGNGIPSWSYLGSKEGSS